MFWTDINILQLWIWIGNHFLNVIAEVYSMQSSLRALPVCISEINYMFAIKILRTWSVRTANKLQFRGTRLAATLMTTSVDRDTTSSALADRAAHARAREFQCKAIVPPEYIFLYIREKKEKVQNQILDDKIHKRRRNWVFYLIFGFMDWTCLKKLVHFRK